jgi:hypothetical protein
MECRFHWLNRSPIYVRPVVQAPARGGEGRNIVAIYVRRIGWTVWPIGIEVRKHEFVLLWSRGGEAARTQGQRRMVHLDEKNQHIFQHA